MGAGGSTAGGGSAPHRDVTAVRLAAAQTALRGLAALPPSMHASARATMAHVAAALGDYALHGSGAHAMRDALAGVADHAQAAAGLAPRGAGTIARALAAPSAVTQQGSMPLALHGLAHRAWWGGGAILRGDAAGAPPPAEAVLALATAVGALDLCRDGLAERVEVAAPGALRPYGGSWPAMVAWRVVAGVLRGRAHPADAALERWMAQPRVSAAYAGALLARAACSPGADAQTPSTPPATEPPVQAVHAVGPPLPAARMEAALQAQWRRLCATAGSQAVCPHVPHLWRRLLLEQGGVEAPSGAEGRAAVASKAAEASAPAASAGGGAAPSEQVASSQTEGALDEAQQEQLQRVLEAAADGLPVAVLCCPATLVALRARGVRMSPFPRCVYDGSVPQSAVDAALAPLLQYLGTLHAAHGGGE